MLSSCQYQYRTKAILEPLDVISAAPLPPATPVGIAVQLSNQVEAKVEPQPQLVAGGTQDLQQELLFEVKAMRVSLVIKSARH